MSWLFFVDFVFYANATRIILINLKSPFYLFFVWRRQNTYNQPPRHKKYWSETFNWISLLPRNVWERNIFSLFFRDHKYSCTEFSAVLVCLLSPTQRSQMLFFSLQNDRRCEGNFFSDTNILSLHEIKIRFITWCNYFLANSFYNRA